jgi:hypothetical protein
MKGTVKMCEVGAEMPAVFRDLFTHKYITSNNIEQNQIKCSMIQTQDHIVVENDQKAQIFDKPQPHKS